MKKEGKKYVCIGGMLLFLFAVWTWLIKFIDVQPAGETETCVGFATFNDWFHKLTGVHMTIYNITDWLGLVPVIVCLMFGALGLWQLIQRKSLCKVDGDLLYLGIYYVIVIACYLIFEMFPVNYRPILINGYQESSYPSSTTLLVLCVMPTLVFQVNRRVKGTGIKQGICFVTVIFSLFMVIGRLVSGVHWFTDIIGSILFSGGLFCMYKAIVLLIYKEEKRRFCDGIL